MAEGCLFCRMASGEMEVEKLYDDDLVFAVRDINPRAPVHVLVVPKEHIPTLGDIDERHASTLYAMMKAANEVAAREGVGERGYRVAINVGREGGQVIRHLHMHLLGGRVLGAEG
ncbi:MAG: histidine triad nucleotide-binding protein [Dehalococcoidia bacterium]|nr:histidine triad nucleotide-binding protein [Dehalococcoidia bacterium]